jgi:hypothetical protein
MRIDAWFGLSLLLFALFGAVYLFLSASQPDSPAVRLLEDGGDVIVRALAGDPEKWVMPEWTKDVIRGGVASALLAAVVSLPLSFVFRRPA